MSDVLTDNIFLRLIRHDDGDVWLLDFTSPHEEWCHQLYSNGQWVDATDTPSQRHFMIHSTAWAQVLCILAVRPADRWIDFSLSPHVIFAPSTWTYRTHIARDPAFIPGDLIELNHDQASGSLPCSPIACRPAWPHAIPHFGFGLGRFGKGGFGIDGDLAVGFAGGAFGLGPFGVGGERLSFIAHLKTTGLHSIQIKSLRYEATDSDECHDYFTSHPPSYPPDFYVDDYDTTTNILLLSY